MPKLAELFTEIRIKGMDKYKSDLKGVRDSTKRFADETKRAGATAEKSFNCARLALTALAAVGAWKALSAVSSAMRESQENAVKLEAVLRATNNAAGITVNQFKAMASSLQETTTFTADTITGMQAVLATFKEIKGDHFREATELALDMSQVLGQDLKSSAIQLGKALNEPLKGVTALQRVGVSFTESQKDMIKGFVEANDIISAQKVILAELASEFGGAAKANADTWIGQLDRMTNGLTDVGKAFGTWIGQVVLSHRRLSSLNELMDNAVAFYEGFPQHIDKVNEEQNALNEAFNRGEIDINVFEMKMAELAGTADKAAPAIKKVIDLFDKDTVSQGKGLSGIVRDLGDDFREMDHLRRKELIKLEGWLESGDVSFEESAKRRREILQEQLEEASRLGFAAQDAAREMEGDPEARDKAIYAAAEKAKRRIASITEQQLRLENEIARKQREQIQEQKKQTEEKRKQMAASMIAEQRDKIDAMRDLVQERREDLQEAVRAVPQARFTDLISRAKGIQLAVTSAEEKEDLRIAKDMLINAKAQLDTERDTLNWLKKDRAIVGN